MGFATTLSEMVIEPVFETEESSSTVSVQQRPTNQLQEIIAIIGYGRM